MARPACSPRAVLWDMDGTLVDSADYHYRAWQAAMAERGRALSRAEFAATFGQRNDAILRRYLGPQVTPEDIQCIGDAKEAHYRALVSAGGIVALPGVREWLARLHAAGWRQAIASSGPRLNAAAIMDALSLRAAFNAVIAAEDAVHGKTHPEGFPGAAAPPGAHPACRVGGGHAP